MKLALEETFPLNMPYLSQDLPARATNIIFALLFILIYSFAFATSTDAVIEYRNSSKTISLGKKLFILEDKESKLSISDVLNNKNFILSNQLIPNLGISESTFWIKFTIKNLCEVESLVIEVQNPVIDEIELYPIGEPSLTRKMGEFKAYSHRVYDHQNYIFDIRIPKNEQRTYFFKVKSAEQLQLPLELGTPKSIFEGIIAKDLVFGIYIGVVLVMCFYNIFIYFTVKDFNYIFYVIYIFTVGLTQACLQGYTFKYIWPDSLWLATQSMFLIPALSGIAVAFFVKKFLKTGEQIPKMDLVLNSFILLYLLSIALSFSHNYQWSLKIIQFNAIFGSLSILVAGIILSVKGQRQAKFFLIAWSMFLIGICIFVLKNIGLLPYNNFTAYTMQAGSAIEVVLLSFALADRINILKKEKEESQLAAFEALKENEHMILNQNILLEGKVKERTLMLEETNDELNTTLSNLKETQSKLVESEKMASLGQLTAGIAHEINNPINFVSSSITPLKRDIKFVIDLLDKYNAVSNEAGMTEMFKEIHQMEKRLDIPYIKEEIETILKGIHDGASRTTEIVKGLKNFSRLDESDLKQANVNQGLDTTLILLNNTLSNIQIVKDYGPIPSIECYAGKINQVFMNIFSNSIHALKNKKTSERPEITIKTWESDKSVHISIRDNGTGIPDTVKNKIFDPFFTTKDVGEGTGLGLSIVYNIIQTHQGQISVQSELGMGTEFFITLPKSQKV